MANDLVQLLIETVGGGSDPAPGSPMPLMFVFLAISLIPFVLLATTSFVKISIVLGLLRSALGVNQVPSGMVITLLSIILSGLVMTPVIEATSSRVNEVLETRATISEPSKKGASSTGNSGLMICLKSLPRIAEPLLHFLKANSNPREIEFFDTLVRQRSSVRSSAKEGLADDITELSLRQPLDSPPDQAVSPDSEANSGPGTMALVAAFVITEMTEAFMVGFGLFLPFLVVDLIVASVLTSVGMTMMSPVTISLPLKIFLFASVSGWLRLSEGLILGYML